MKRNAEEHREPRKIITKISDKYGICPYGVNGMEIIKDGRQIAKFTAGETRLQNWEAAVRYIGRENENQG